MAILCALFVIGVIAIFVDILIVAVIALGFCARTLGLSILTVAVIAWLSIWLYRLCKRILDGK